jgi:hypothetical protein
VSCGSCLGEESVNSSWIVEPAYQFAGRKKARLAGTFGAGSLYLAPNRRRS